MKRSLVVVVLSALLPFMADAQRSASASPRSAPSAPVAARPAPARNFTTARTSPRNNNQPSRGQAPSQRFRPSNPSPQSRFSLGHAPVLAPRTAVASPVVTQPRSSSIAGTSFHHRGWWPGGFYGPVFYPVGWYDEPWFAVGLWYYEPFGFGYRSTIGELANLSGIKFDLDMLPEKDRKAVSDGEVYLPGEYGLGGSYGRVKNFSGLMGKVLHLGPGNHNVTVEIQGGQKINVCVAVQEGHVTHVALNFDPVRQKEGQRLADNPPPPPPDNPQPLIPATGGKNPAAVAPQPAQPEE